MYFLSSKIKENAYHYTTHFMFVHRELVFADGEHVFMHREHMFIAREQTFQRVIKSIRPLFLHSYS